MTTALTHGQEALAEAARIESARVYGRTCRETPKPKVVPVPAATVDLAAARIRRAS